MATIVVKNPRRFRMQFSMSRALYNEYQQCLRLADELKVNIDFSRDFERWLSGQLEQANRELKKMKGQQNEEGSGQCTPKKCLKQADAQPNEVKAHAPSPKVEDSPPGITSSDEFFSDLEEKNRPCSNEAVDHDDDNQ